MKQRTITAFFIGLILIPSLLYHAWSAIAILSIICFFSAYEWIQFIKNQITPLYKTMFLGLHAILALIIAVSQQEQYQLTLQFTTPVLCIILLMYSSLIFQQDLKLNAYAIYGMGLCYIFLSMYITACFYASDFKTNSIVAFCLICTNWANDIFAYLSGRFLGKHKLLERISPKKTIEGAIGGMTFAVLCSVLFCQQFNLLGAWQSVVLGIVVAIAGMTGDLFESMIKRQVGVKDSGSLLPGHGGFLDRFDSFFYIMPFGILAFLLLR